MTSLRIRLSVFTAVVVAAAVAAQWWFISENMRGMVESQMRSRLAHDAETIAANFDPEAGGTIVPGKMGTEYSRAYSGHYFLVSGPGVLVVSRSAWDFRFDNSLCDRGSGAGPMKQRLLVYCMPVRKGGTSYTILVAEETTLERDLAAFQREFTARSFAALLLILAVQALAVYAALAPLRRAVKRLREGNESPPNSFFPDEVRPFAAEIDRLLESARRRVAVSRETAANLAHEQKTHLASIQASVESIREGGPAEEALGHIASSVQHLKQAAERHLARAAVAGESKAGKPFDWGRDLSDLRGTLLRIYRDRTIYVESESSPLFSLERQDAIELFGILLDNACRFSRKEVRITLRRAAVLIDDDGPGVTGEKALLLGVRGARVDESTESGIGLSIARDIAERYNLHLVFASSPAGGLRVSLEPART